MTTLSEFAVLSARVYQDARGDFNKNPLPPSWTEIAYVSDMTDSATSNGLSVGAYQNSNGEIVIAFKGTDFLFGSNNGQTEADLSSDLSLGFGLGSSQLIEAALFYEKIKTENPGKTITFTGHSLGAGLASLMSVWFNKEATVFADAPFYISALNGTFAKIVQDAIQAKGYTDPEFEQLIQTTSNDAGTTYAVNGSTIAARKSQVTSYYVQGEVLNQYLGWAPTIVGSNNLIAIGGGDQVSAVTLHSIVLHAALLLIDKLRADTLALPNLIAAIFDETLYSRSLNLDKQDFLSKLLNAQISLIGGDMSGGLLSRFAADLAKLTQGGLAQSNTPLNKAIIASAIEDYYFMQSAPGKSFFTDGGNGIGFNLAGINGIASNDQLGRKQLIAAANAFIWNNDAMATGIIASANNWFIQSGASGMTASGKGGSGDDVMIGGGTGNTLIGGDNNNVLIAGTGNDTLRGGKGNNYLQAGFSNNWLFGQGNDKFELTNVGLTGIDHIRENGGKGTIWIDNTQLGTDKVEYTKKDTWGKDGSVQYKYDDKKNTLLIIGGVLGASQIEIDNFTRQALDAAEGTDGYLGIHLSRPDQVVARTIAAMPTNPFDDPNFNPDTAATPTSEMSDGGMGMYAVYLPEAAGENGQQIKIQLEGGDSSGLRVQAGNQILTPNNGSFTLTVRPGEKQATFSLLSEGDIGSDQTYTVQATLVDASGQTAYQTHTVASITLKDQLKDAQTTVDVLGGFKPQNFGTDAQPEYRQDDLGNYLVDQNQALGADDIDYLYSGDANAHVVGGQNHDSITGGTGNNLIEGHGGVDVIYGGTGNNRIYADVKVSLQDAINSTAQATGKQGSWIDGGSGDSLIVGDANNDVLMGNGNDTIIAGNGDNYIMGHTDWQAASFD